MDMWFLTLRIILGHSDHEEVSPSAQQLVYLQVKYMSCSRVRHGQSYAACLPARSCFGSQYISNLET